MIVIGTHGRTRLARFMVGSVAYRVISDARCPVLTVRGTATA
jgi:nucleotide-binding universal stress UspA family protein